MSDAWTSSFFEPRRPDDVASPPVPPRPPWSPPEDEMGVVVPIGLVLARSEPAVAVIAGITAYSKSFELRVTLVTREPDVLRGGAMHVGPHRPGPLTPEFFRFGVGFADGRRTSNTEWGRGEAARKWFEAQREGREAELPAGPILMPGSGGGGGTRWNWTYFVWPLPPQGPLTFAAEWPRMEIPETRHEIDAGQILEAAKRSEKLWSDT